MIYIDTNIWNVLLGYEAQGRFRQELSSSRVETTIGHTAGTSQC
jgi:hypothetical protein